MAKQLTIPSVVLFFMLGIIISGVLQSCKHEPLTINGEDPTYTPPTPIPGIDTLKTTDGAILYANICASCHGPLESSSKLGATPTQIQNGISTISQMISLSSLTPTQIQAIADVLKTTTPPPTPTDGATLYANNCASCHGTLSSSLKLGATVTQIQNGIISISDMNSLSTLTIAQIQAIADVLKTSVPPPVITDGATLYANNCASCHGPLASSAKLGTSATQIQNGINTISQMNSLSTLTFSQIQAIADVLITTTPPPTSTDGATLYANNCASCHGPLASSAKLGTSATQIQNGINTISDMNSLSSLTTAQIQAIADVLKTTTPPPTPTDGATLYANNCASCHGQLATSSKIGATASRIQIGINSISNMNSLSVLSTAQVQAIADALNSTPMPTDGASLYAINCASCHRDLANSQVGGSSLSKIQEAIKDKRQMNYLSSLTIAQLQAIAGALANINGGDDD